jgi:hypothetical protein
LLNELESEALQRGIRLPTQPTVAKYGMGRLEWLLMLRDQGWKCPIRDHFVREFVTDHEHVRGWKKMPPDERRGYVRGLVCRGDNYFVLSRHIDTSQLALRVASYLKNYEGRRPR